VREIADGGSESGINVEENTESVLILSNEHDLFPTRPRSIQTKYRTSYTLSPYANIRYKLAKALVWDGRDELADKVLASIEIEDYDELRCIKISQALEMERYLAKAARGELSRKQRKQLRKEARNFFQTNTVNEFGSGANASLALVLAADRHKYRFETANKATAKEIIEGLPDRFFWEKYIRPEESDLYEKLFPASAATLDWELEKRVRLLARAGKDVEADRLLDELIESEKETSVIKLAGSVAMAFAFKERPDDRIESTARVAADMELLEAEIVEDDTVYKGLVDRIAARQMAAQRVARILNKIDHLPDEEQRTLYRKQLGQLGRLAEKGNGSVLAEAINRFKNLSPKRTAS